MACRRCEQMRKSFGRAWRAVTRTGCAIPGCDGVGRPRLCEAHWRAVSRTLRMRWWEETDYGRHPPSQKLLDETIQALRMK